MAPTWPIWFTVPDSGPKPVCPTFGISIDRPNVGQTGFGPLSGTENHMAKSGTRGTLSRVTFALPRCSECNFDMLDAALERAWVVAGTPQPESRSLELVSMHHQLPSKQSLLQILQASSPYSCATAPACTLTTHPGTPSRRSGVSGRRRGHLERSVRGSLFQEELPEDDEQTPDGLALNELPHALGLAGAHTVLMKST